MIARLKWLTWLLQAALFAQHAARMMARAETPSELEQRYATLAKLSEHALQSSDLVQVLNEACDSVTHSVGAASTQILELQDDGVTFVLKAGARGKLDSSVAAFDVRVPTNNLEIQLIAPGRMVANVAIARGRDERPFGILQVIQADAKQFTQSNLDLLRVYASVIATAVDRVRVTEQGRDAEERLRLALGAGEFGTWEIDLATGAATSTARTLQIFGYTAPPPAWSYQSFLEHVLPEEREHVAGVFRAGSGAGLKWQLECRIRRAGDGEVRWIEARCGPSGARANDRSTHVIGIVADVTDRKQAEEALLRSNEVLEAKVLAQQAQQELEARFHFASQAGRFGVWELNLHTGELAASDAFKDDFGRDSTAAFTYKELQDAIHVDDRERLRVAVEQSIMTGADFDIEYRIIRSSGATGWMQVRAQVHRAADGTALRLAGISLDITERVRIEERIRQSQRVEAVGRLTAGVAHDFNNVLQALLGALELAIDDVADLPHVRTELEFALQAGQRGARLTSHLLSFSRQQVLHPTALQLPKLLAELSRTLERTLGHEISVRIDVADDLPLVLADAAHLDSALLNLALNARDAMTRGGNLQIKGFAVGDQVVIAVKDDGEGMTPETLAHACEPFFSTKGAKGSGLGLSMVQGFARQSGGELRIQSTQGEGTRVEIWLPVARQPAATAPAPKTQQLSGQGRILVVDDDVDVGRVTTSFLQRSGFDVVAVSNGAEALAVLAGNLRFNALVTDYAMPGMNGAELVTKARELHSALPALVITGYAGAEGLDRLPSSTTILRKPFQREDLVREIKDLVEAAVLRPGINAERTAPVRDVVSYSAT